MDPELGAGGAGGKAGLAFANVKLVDGLTV